MRKRREIFTKVWTAKLVFIPIKSKFKRSRYLCFGPKDNFIWDFSSCVVATCVVGECKLRCYWRPVISGIIEKVLQSREISCFWVSILPFVQGEWAVRGLRVIPRSLVQLTNCVLMKTVPRSWMIHCGIPKERNHFSTAEIVATAVVLRTG